jgi:predicted negative regulator of RcsB-dependent stress response
MIIVTRWILGSWQKQMPRSLILITALFLGGCAVLRTDAPPTQPSDNTAVIALLNQAKNQSSAGRMDQANANLERALRIEPRNPVLWHELARLRLEQGQYRQAENMAAKSNILARTNRYLQAKNWRIIGEARSRRGDLQGAREAFKKAEQSP